jgi:hypothetical protein
MHVDKTGIPQACRADIPAVFKPGNPGVHFADRTTVSVGPEQLLDHFVGKFPPCGLFDPLQNDDAL